MSPFRSPPASPPSSRGLPPPPCAPPTPGFSILVPRRRWREERGVPSCRHRIWPGEGAPSLALPPPGPDLAGGGGCVPRAAVDETGSSRQRRARPPCRRRRAPCSPAWVGVAAGRGPERAAVAGRDTPQRETSTRERSERGESAPEQLRERERQLREKEVLRPRCER